MFRIDLRHIMGHTPSFDEFSRELTDLAETVLDAGCRLCLEELEARYGTPQLDGRRCALSVCALGKCGGRELGFASDLELLFVYEGRGRTTGPESITNTEFFQKLVEIFRKTIEARREGIFQIDLRLRPYGKAGSLAVTLETFRKYFEPGGPAWPYERQALVKLRPIAGDAAFGRQVEHTRDDLVYTGKTFDTAAMRAMREKQLRQLVRAGTFNAKLSSGGLVDCEYLVQGLQIMWGGRFPSVRRTNTMEAMRALRDAGVLSEGDFTELRAAYIFLRRLIDALRMVRGHARDLSVPPAGSEEFDFLARRLGYGHATDRLAADLERHTHRVREFTRLLDATHPQ